MWCLSSLTTTINCGIDIKSQPFLIVSYHLSVPASSLPVNNKISKSLRSVNEKLLNKNNIAKSMILV